MGVKDKWKMWWNRAHVLSVGRNIYFIKALSLDTKKLVIPALCRLMKQNIFKNIYDQQKIINNKDNILWGKVNQ